MYEFDLIERLVLNVSSMKGNHMAIYMFRTYAVLLHTKHKESVALAVAASKYQNMGVSTVKVVCIFAGFTFLCLAIVGGIIGAIVAIANIVRDCSD